jgi:hypothetical protein
MKQGSMHSSWETWFEELKEIARADGFREAAIDYAFDRNQEVWRDAFSEGQEPMQAYREGMDLN